MKLKHALSLLCALTLWPLLSSAELNIEITKGVAGAVPIAVLSENGNSNVSFEEIANIVRNDLRTSGRFQPLSPNDIPNAFKSNPLGSAQWQDLGVENLITGAIQSNGG